MEIADEEVSFNVSIGAAMQSAVAKAMSEAGMSQQKNTQESTQMLPIDKLLSSLLMAIQPILINTVTDAINKAISVATKELTENVIKDVQEHNAKTEKIKGETQRHGFEIHRLEQYTRKENVRIAGLPESDGENTTELIVNMAKAIGVEISTADISVSHRLPQRNTQRPRPIIAKFVRREKKTEVMKAKKNLKSKQEYKGVYIDDDLTQMRGKIMKALREDSNIKRCWSIDGKIFCRVLEKGNEITKVVDSPEHLFKLGWPESKVKELGLYYSF